MVNIGTIKPLDTETILALAKETHAIVAVEEHQIAGGMGSAIAEYLASVFPTSIEFVGVKNLFGQSGTPLELIEKYEMGITHIETAVRKVLDRK